MQIAFKKLRPDAKIPGYAYGNDAGMDLYYAGDTDVTINARQRTVLGTGIAMAIPRLNVGLIWDKSGIAVTQGLKVMGGVIDAGYRGEIMVCLLNTTAQDVVIQPGQKIAQMIIQPIHQPVIRVFADDAELPPAKDVRGTQGFGSSGLT